MLTVKDLDEMNQLDLRKIDKTKLADIRKIVIDTDLSPEQRMINYLEQVKNPYCFLCGDSIVRIRFQATDELKGKLENFFISMKKS